MADVVLPSPLPSLVLEKVICGRFVDRVCDMWAAVDIRWNSLGLWPAGARILPLPRVWSCDTLLSTEPRHRHRNSHPLGFAETLLGFCAAPTLASQC